MTAMGPSPRFPDTQAQGEAEVLDEIIDRITKALPAVHRLAADQDDVEDSPKTKLSAEAREIFQDMCDDPLLDDEGVDICITKPKRPKKTKRPPTRINGKHP